jgi:hypothetical protein
MASIYVSSTYEDLKDCRLAVYKTLAKMKHDVSAMEDYAAGDKRPLDLVCEHVANSDLYIGLFAWRYGFVPEKDNPQQRSITELEYLQARASGKPCLIFILDKDAPWPASAMDSISGEKYGADQIARLRSELEKEHTVSYFRGPDDLAREVSIAVHLQLQVGDSVSESIIEDFEGAVLVDAMKPHLIDIADPWAVQFGQTLYPELLETLVNAVLKAKSARFVEVNLGSGRSWWSTRLHLMSALTTDYTEIEQFVFLADNHKFLGFASAKDTYTAFAARYPHVESAYRSSWAGAARDPLERKKALETTLMNFSIAVGNLAPEGSEPREEFVKEWVTAEILCDCLGKSLQNESMELKGRAVTPLLIYEILAFKSALVAVLEDEELVQVLDRCKLATRLARSILQQRLERTGLGF